MTTLRIGLGKYNMEGLYASIENEEMDEMLIHVDRHSGDATHVCKEAANKLRLLAAAFERLATSPNPCQVSAQEAAMEVALENQRRAT